MVSKVKVIRAMDVFSEVGGKLSGVFIIMGLALIVIEIIVRSVFHGTIYVAEEYSGYLMSALTFVAFGYTLKEKGHIRMTLLRQKLSERKKAFLDLFCYGIGIVFSVILLYVTFGYFWNSVISGTRSMQISKTYLAIPQFFLPFGSSMLFLQFISEFAKCLIAIKTRDYSILGKEVEELGR